MSWDRDMKLSKASLATIRHLEAYKEALTLTPGYRWLGWQTRGYGRNGWGIQLPNHHVVRLSHPDYQLESDWAPEGAAYAKLAAGQLELQVSGDSDYLADAARMIEEVLGPQGTHYAFGEYLRQARQIDGAQLTLQTNTEQGIDLEIYIPEEIWQTVGGA